MRTFVAVAAATGAAAVAANDIGWQASLVGAK